jgi:hypothetical protein
MAYASSLAESAKLKRSLFNIGSAIDKGDLATAESKLTSLLKDYPQYATAGDTAANPDSINAHFQAVSQAISQKDIGAAKTAWNTVKNDLAKSGITLSDSGTEAAKIMAENKAAADRSILDAMFGGSSEKSLVSTLLGGSASSDTSNSLSSLVSKWVTYKSTGTTSETQTDSDTPKILDTSA